MRGARAAAAAAVAPRGISVSRPSMPRPQLVHVARGFSPARTWERLVRGNGWVALLAVLLLGIVFMQVHMLKLNAGISRAVESSGTLERQNAQLRQEVSQLGAADRIEEAAGMFGMVMPQPGSVRYLDSRDVVVDATRAAKTMTAPDPTAAAAAGAAPVVAGAPAATSVAPAATTDPAATAAPATSVAPQSEPVEPVTAPAATPPPDPVATPPAAAAAPATATPAPATGGATPGQP
ncbi:MAG: hypothetical protein JHC84_09965 [Solirubrobacteraceae bacterium]|nr:hypothetical protein [Solirubrobacteraceae bacterium]